MKLYNVKLFYGVEYSWKRFDILAEDEAEVMEYINEEYPLQFRESKLGIDTLEIDVLDDDVKMPVVIKEY